jgi:hypothetical protein
MTTQTMPVNSTLGNGHFTYRARGATFFDGEYEGVPMPTTPVSTEEAVEAMFEDGYVIFRGVLNKQEVATLRAHFDASGGPDEQYHVKDWCFNKHVTLDFPNDPRLLQYIDRPGIIDVADAIHKVPDLKSEGAIVAGGSMWVTGQGRKMGTHVDFQPTTLPESVFEDPEVRVPIFSSTAHYYLNDMRADLGPTTVIPGSHKAGRYPEDQSGWRGQNPKAVMVNAGDVLLFRGDIWHGAGMNTSTEKRYMMQVHYASCFMARHYPAMKYDKYWNQAVIDKATPRQKRLLGAAPVQNNAKSA